MTTCYRYAPPMPRSLAVRSVAGVVAAGLLLTGCGGGSRVARSSTTTSSAPTTTSSTSTSTTSAPPVVKAEYVDEANAICKTMNDAVAALPDPSGDPKKLADVLDAGIPIISEALGTLRALPPPPGDEAELEAIWSKVDVMLDSYRQLAVAIRNDETDRLPELGSVADASQAAANDASNGYGLTVCGS